MVDTFPAYTPTIKSRPSTDLRVKRAKFGDGYSQRVIDGLNNVDTDWTLIWTALNSTARDVIVNFLKAKGGATSFYWTPPGEITPRLWTCAKYEGPEAISGNLWSITAMFHEEFDIVV